MNRWYGFRAGLIVAFMLGAGWAAEARTWIVHDHDNNRPNTADPDDITAICPRGLGILLVGADTTTGY
jgi:hypothetical protein